MSAILLDFLINASNRCTSVHLMSVRDCKAVLDAKTSASYSTALFAFLSVFEVACGFLCLAAFLRSRKRGMMSDAHKSSKATRDLRLPRYSLLMTYASFSGACVWLGFLQWQRLLKDSRSVQGSDCRLSYEISVQAQSWQTM